MTIRGCCTIDKNFLLIFSSVKWDVHPDEITGGMSGGGFRVGGEGGGWGGVYLGGWRGSGKMMDNNANPELLKEHLLGIRCLKLSFLVNQTPPLGAHLSLDQSAAFSCYLKHTHMHTHTVLSFSVSVRSPEVKVWWIPQDRKRCSHLKEMRPSFLTVKKTPRLLHFIFTLIWDDNPSCPFVYLVQGCWTKTDRFWILVHPWFMCWPNTLLVCHNMTSFSSLHLLCGAERFDMLFVTSNSTSNPGEITSHQEREGKKML